MRLPALLLLPILFAYAEDAPAVDLMKVPEVGPILKDMERGATEARVKEIQKAVKKLEPVAKKMAGRDIKMAAEVAHKIDDLNKEAADLSESLKDAPAGMSLVGSWRSNINGTNNGILTIKENGAASLNIKGKIYQGKYAKKDTANGEITWDNGSVWKIQQRDGKITAIAPDGQTILTKEAEAK